MVLEADIDGDGQVIEICTFVTRFAADLYQICTFVTDNQVTYEEFLAMMTAEQCVFSSGPAVV